MTGAVPMQKVHRREQAVLGLYRLPRIVLALSRRATLVLLLSYSTITQSLLLRPKTSGEYISSALDGGTTKVPGVVALAI